MHKQGEIVLIPVPFSDLTSAVRADKVYTLSKHIVVKKFGQVKPEILEDVCTKINWLINK